MTQAEENYLKSIYHLSQETDDAVGTNLIAQEMNTSAASVTDMVKRLSEKGLVDYEKYRGVHLSEEGRAKAKEMIRNHRLWEVFLVKKLNFGWDEIHEIAEQLEHIKSKKLIRRLDEYLGFPKYDPHGDPIPDSSGNITYRSQVVLSELEEGQECVLVGVKDTSAAFLQFLDKVGLSLGIHLSVENIYDYDESMVLHMESRKLVISNQVSSNLYVKLI